MAGSPFNTVAECNGISKAFNAGKAVLPEGHRSDQKCLEALLRDLTVRSGRDQFCAVSPDRGFGATGASWSETILSSLKTWPSASTGPLGNLLGKRPERKLSQQETVIRRKK